MKSTATEGIVHTYDTSEDDERASGSPGSDGRR